MNTTTLAAPSGTEQRQADTAELRLGGVWLAAAKIAAVMTAVWYVALVGFGRDRAPHNDFGRFYESTRTFAAGGGLYDWNPTIPDEFTSPIDGSVHVINLWNMNPPHFHLLILPLAWLPPAPAFNTWTVLGLACLAASMRMIIRELGLRARPVPRQLLIALTLGVATPITLITGQVSWYLLLPVTLMWLSARAGRWGAAGAWLGIAGAWKPFLLIFLAYLLLRRQWRALGLAVVTVSLSFGAGLAVFGVESHRSWLACIGQADSWSWLHINAGLWGFLTRCGSANPHFVPVVELPFGVLKAIWLLGGGLIGGATLLVAALDRTPQSVDRAFSLLLLASILICPLGWNYYWFLVLGPAAGVLLVSRGPQDSVGRIAATPYERCLLGLAAVGWYTPIFVPHLHSGMVATATLSSIYFWSTFALWSAIAFDGLRCVIPVAKGMLAERLAAPAQLEVVL